MGILAKQMKRGWGLVTFHLSAFVPAQYAPQFLDWTGGYFDWQGGHGEGGFFGFKNDAAHERWHSARRVLEDAEVKVASPKHPIDNRDFFISRYRGVLLSAETSPTEFGPDADPSGARDRECTGRSNRCVGIAAEGWGPRFRHLDGPILQELAAGRFREDGLKRAGLVGAWTCPPKWCRVTSDPGQAQQSRFVSVGSVTD